MGAQVYSHISMCMHMHLEPENNLDVFVQEPYMYVVL